MSQFMRKLTFEALETMNADQQVSFHIDFLKEMSEAKDQTSLLNIISKWAHIVLEVERCSVALVEPDRKHFSVFALTGNDAVAQGSQIPIDQSGLGMAILENAVYMCEDTSSYPDLLDCNGLSSGGLFSYVDVPFVINGEVYGTVNIARAEKASVSIEDAFKLYGFSLVIANHFKKVLFIEEIKKQAEREKELIAQNVHSSRMASLGQMAGGIAHEVNNPLALIDGIVAKIEILQKRNQLTDEKLDMNLKKVRSIVQRVVKIVKSLRSFSRESSHDPVTEIGAGQLVEETLAFCQANFKYNEVDIRFTAPNPDIPIQCRTVEIQQVILNLINNAFDVAVKQSEKWIEIRIEKLADELVITVGDSGQGIEKDLLDKIMNPFFTTKPVGEGTGLGLSISKGIIESHSGSLVVNTESKNTEFQIKLPLTANVKEAA